MIAGHLDTVPANQNFPSRLEDGILHGLGSCDMKGGVAVALLLAAHVAAPARDVTYVFYEARRSPRSSTASAVSRARDPISWPATSRS